MSEPNACMPKFHRPASIGRRKAIFYVVFAPSDVAGVYLSWHQVAGLSGITHQSFETAQAAIAGFQEYCALHHGGQHPAPPAPSERFSVETYNEFLRNVRPDLTYQQPNQPRAPDAQPVPLVGAEPSVPGTPAPPYTMPSPPPSPRAGRHSTSSRGASASTFVQSLSSSSSSTTLPPSSRHPAHPSASSSSPSTHSHSRHHSSPSKKRAQAPGAGGISGSPLQGAVTIASSSSGAATRSSAPTAAPSGSSRRTHSHRSHSSRVAASSGSDVASWVDSTAAALGRLSVGAVDVYEAEGVAQLRDDELSYVVGGPGLVPTVFARREDARDALRLLFDAGHLEARMLTAGNKEDRARIVADLR